MRCTPMCRRWSGARLAAGQAEWLAELRRVTVLFLELLDPDPAPTTCWGGPSGHARSSRSCSATRAASTSWASTTRASRWWPRSGCRRWPTRTTRPGRSGPRWRCRALVELGVRCAIGVATGRAFCGAVGSDVRREYT